MTSWTITKDHVADEGAKPGTNANAVGVVGPRTATHTHEQLLAHAEAKRFRMYDDDGELYYEGVVVGDAMAPLRDFGRPNAGCTHIKILNASTGVWEIQ